MRTVIVTCLILLAVTSSCFTVESILQHLLHQDYSKGIAKANDPSDDKLRFIVFGDFGRVNLYQNISKVANAMNVLAQKDHYEFMTTVGDNFYPNGIRYSWMRIVPWIVMSNYKRNAIKDIPIHGSIGNHDWYSNYSNEVMFTKYDNQWTVPSDYYVLKTPLNDHSNQYFVNLMLNSCKMYCTSTEWGGFAEECNDMHIEPNGIEVNEMYSWLREQLEIHTNDPDVAWVAVSLHHPPMVEQGLKKYMLPILKEYEIDIIFTGHDHWMEYTNMDYNYQLKYPDDRRGNVILDDCTGTGKREFMASDSRSLTFNKGDKMHQLMSGGAGASLDGLCPVTDQDGDVTYRITELGLMTAEVTSYQFVAIYYNQDAEEVFRVTINK